MFLLTQRIRTLRKPLDSKKSLKELLHQSINFSVQNSLKLTYGIFNIKIFLGASPNDRGRRVREGKGKGGEEREGKGLMHGTPY